MKIGIIGWGSLIWNSQALNYDTDFGWREDGPLLPIEFARISNNGRLTLVIKKRANIVTTLYTISKYKEIDEAILDLAIREGCGKNKIGYFFKREEQIYPTDSIIKKQLGEWVKEKDIDAIIWTNLPPNFKDKIGQDFNPTNVINYLKYLPNDVQALAEEYIRKAPKQVSTEVREAIEKELGWKEIMSFLPQL